jgi:hypothetical protein
MRFDRAPVTHIAVLVGLLAFASAASAFDALMDRLPGGRRSELFGARTARARVKDGLLIGRGDERSEVRADGRLEVSRTRTYERVKHPKNGKVVSLPEPWHVRSTLTLSPELRLIETETRVEFHRSVDRALKYPFTDKFGKLFAWDRAHTVANRSGTKLTRTLMLGDKVVERDTYDYEREAIPLEIVGLVLAHAVKSRVPAFNFQLLLPGGDTHGIRSRVHRTRDLSRFAKGYPVSLPKLTPGAEFAVVDMWLASPVKRVFFPHHFYLVYASEDPADLIALWGGAPDEHLQAFRE